MIAARRTAGDASRRRGSRSIYGTISLFSPASNGGRGSPDPAKRFDRVVPDCEPMASKHKGRLKQFHDDPSVGSVSFFLWILPNPVEPPSLDEAIRSFRFR